MKNIIIPAIAALISVSAFAEDDYDVVKRFTILEDKFKTHEMLNPYKHDFLLDASVYANKNLVTFMDDVSEIEDAPDDEQYDKAVEILSEYDKTEQTVRLNTQIGIPLPTFHAFGIKFVPDLRLGVSGGINMGIRSQELTTDTLIAVLGDSIDPVLSDAIKDFDSGDLQDIFDQLQNEGGDVIAAALAAEAAGHITLSAAAKAEAEAQVGNYYLTESSDANPIEPVVHAYSKVDAKGGLLLNYFKKRWFGYVNLYGLYRADALKIVTATALTNDEEIFDTDKDLHKALSVDTDIKIGYRTGRYTIFTTVEEVKLATLSDNEDETGAMVYEHDPLFRLHGDIMFKPIGFTFKPFAGIHSRSAYDVTDGLYAGVDFGYTFWKDRLGLIVRGMVDNEHITVAPNLKFGLGQLEYMVKVPVSSEIDGVEPSAVHSLNFRIAI